MSFNPIKLGNLTVRLARDQQEINLAQKLRYKIFCEEMGATATPDVIRTKTDFGDFDQVCDHLLVIDEDIIGDDKIVGTYRLLRSEPMRKLGRFYTEGEFDISSIKKTNQELLELGRSCVDANYRNKAVMAVLWKGIGAYTLEYNIKFMFGCASFCGADPEQHSIALSYLYHHHLADQNIRLKALPDQYVEMNRVSKQQIDERDAIRLIPPLIKGYLRLNGKIGDGAVIDRAFNTTDVAIIVQTDRISERYHEKFVAKAA